MAHLFEVLFDGFGGGMVILCLTILWTNHQSKKKHTPIVRHSKHGIWLLSAVILAVILIGVGVAIHFIWKPAPTPAANQSVQTQQTQTTHQPQATTPTTSKGVATTSDEITAILCKQLQVDDCSKITPDKDLVLDLGADPLDKVEVMMQIELAYDIKIPDKDIRKFKSVGDLINYTERRLKEKDRGQHPTPNTH